MSSPAAEAVVAEQIRMLNGGDAAGSTATFADEALNHGMQVPRAGIEAVFRSLLMALPDLHLEVLEMVSDGEVVACKQRHWYRVRDERIIEHWAVRDDLTGARQLGLVD